MLDPISKFLIYRSMKSGNLSLRPTVLMYHGTPYNHPSSEYSIKADIFEEHLKYFERNGWKMAKSGMEIASHTYSHPDLSSLDFDRQLDEMTSSKLKLETLLQNDVVSFAYPFGKYTKKSIEAARPAGYSIACTTSSGSLQPKTNPMLVPRITIFRNDTVSNLVRKLAFVDNEVPLGKIATYYLKRVRDRLHTDQNLH